MICKKERWKYSIQKCQRKNKKNRTFVYTSSCRVEKFGRAPGVNANRQNQCRTTQVSFQPDSINTDACWSSTPQKRQLFSHPGQTGRNIWFLHSMKEKSAWRTPGSFWWFKIDVSWNNQGKMPSAMIRFVRVHLCKIVWNNIIQYFKQRNSQMWCAVIDAFFSYIIC